MKHYLWILLTIAVVSSCSGRHVTARVPGQPGTFAEGPGWAAGFTTVHGPDCEPPRCESIILYVRSGQYIPAARQEVCSRSYVCVGPEPAGQILIVERRRR